MSVPAKSSPSQTPAEFFQVLLKCCDAYQAAAPANTNDHPAGADITPFHSAAEPPMTLAQYAHRIAYYTGYGCDGLVYGLVLMSRFAVASAKMPSRLMLHRLLLASVQLGMKTNCDFFTKNVYVAQIGGVALREINKLECTLAAMLDFRAMATASELTQVIDTLVKFASSVEAGSHLLPALASVVNPSFIPNAGAWTAMPCDDGVTSPHPFKRRSSAAEFRSGDAYPGAEPPSPSPIALATGRSTCLAEDCMSAEALAR